MPRISRANLKASLFHVMTQGINKEYIFNNSEDIQWYLSVMSKLSEQYNIEIISYCVMSNHVHMLLKAEDTKELGKYMQKLSMKYGRYYNNKYNRVGYVFRGRYKAEAIMDEKHMYNCIRYIYNNPVVAGICSEPKEYPYSDYKEMPTCEIVDYVFADIDEDVKGVNKNVVERFLLKNNIKLNEIKKDTKKLSELIATLRDNYNVSLREIAKELEVNRESVRKLYKK